MRDGDDGPYAFAKSGKKQDSNYAYRSDEILIGRRTAFEKPS